MGPRRLLGILGAGGAAAKAAATRRRVVAHHAQFGEHARVDGGQLYLTLLEAQQLALADAFPESMRERVHAPPPHGAVVPRLAVGELEDDDDD